MKFKTITVAICFSLACPSAALPDNLSNFVAVKSSVTESGETETTLAKSTGAVSNLIKANISSQTVDSASLQAKSVPRGERPFGKFYVLSDDPARNHFTPAGWMGDSSDLKVGAVYIDDRPDLGKTGMRVTYLARGKKGWVGIFWQHPANNWGEINGGFNLKGAKYITFWARGEKGGEKISEFKMGGLTGKYPDSDIAWIGPVKLKKTWFPYKINLKGKDLRYISGGFCFTVLASDNPSGCTFFIADVKYE